MVGITVSSGNVATLANTALGLSNQRQRDRFEYTRQREATRAFDEQVKQFNQTMGYNRDVLAEQTRAAMAGEGLEQERNKLLGQQLDSLDYEIREAAKLNRDKFNHTVSTYEREQAAAHIAAAGRNMYNTFAKYAPDGDKGNLAEGFKNFAQNPANLRSMARTVTALPGVRAALIEEGHSIDPNTLTAELLSNDTVVFSGADKNTGQKVFLSKNGRVVADNPAESIVGFDAEDILAGMRSGMAEFGLADEVLAMDNMISTLYGVPAEQVAETPGLDMPREWLRQVKLNTADPSVESRASAANVDPRALAAINSRVLGGTEDTMAARASAVAAGDGLPGTLEYAEQFSTPGEVVTVKDEEGRERAVQVGGRTGKRELRQRVLSSDPAAIQQWMAPFQARLTGEYKRATGGNVFNRTIQDILGMSPDYDDPDDLAFDVQRTVISNPEFAEKIVGAKIENWQTRHFVKYARELAEARKSESKSWAESIGDAWDTTKDVIKDVNYLNRRFRQGTNELNREVLERASDVTPQWWKNIPKRLGFEDEDD